METLEEKSDYFAYAIHQYSNQKSAQSLPKTDSLNLFTNYHHTQIKQISEESTPQNGQRQQNSDANILSSDEPQNKSPQTFEEFQNPVQTIESIQEQFPNSHENSQSSSPITNDIISIISECFQ
jgi:hypothetical protein